MPLFDTAEALREVSRDLRDGFDGIFEGVGDLRPVGVFRDEPVGSVSDTVSVLAWEWPIRHIGPLQGTPPTGKFLTLRGVTVIDGHDTDLLFARYIDWLALYAEMGAITMVRPPVDDRGAIPALPDNVPFPLPPSP